MNILWIEDFGGGFPANSTTLGALFRDVVPKDTWRDHWDDDEINLLAAPGHLRDFSRKHAPFGEICLCRHWPDFEDLRAAEPGRSVADAFDVVVIDINLAEGVDSARAIPEAFRGDPRQFHRKAGFFIFHTLLREGFPPEGIAFLTGEMGSSFAEFEGHCRESLMPTPLAFEKTDSGLGAFRDWLKGRYRDSYRLLRRGVLEGCRDLGRRLAADPEFAAPFRRFLGPGETHPDASDHLATLLETLPPLVPPRRLTPFGAFHATFLRSLSREWESRYQPRPAVQGGPRGEEYWQCRCLGQIMKSARNWTSHDQRVQPTRTPEGDLAFLFLVNARAVFNLPPGIEPYERQLLLAIGGPDASPPSPMDVKKITDHGKSLLAESFQATKTRANKFLERSEGLLHFDALVNALHRGETGDLNFMDYLYLLFWHGLADIRVSLAKGKPAEQPDAIEIPAIFRLVFKRTALTQHDLFLALGHALYLRSQAK